MITMYLVDAIAGTRLRTRYAVGSAQPSGMGFWRQSPPVGVGVSKVKNNSTRVSEVEHRHR